MLQSFSAKPWLARPLYISASNVLTQPYFVYCCRVQLGSLLLCFPSLTGVIIEVTQRSGRFPLLGWQSTVLLKPRISSGSPLKGGGLCPLASPSSTVFPLWLPWPTLHLLVRLLLALCFVESSTTVQVQYKMFRTPVVSSTCLHLSFSTFLISDFAYRSFSCLFFMIGWQFRDTTVLVQGKMGMVKSFQLKELGKLGGQRAGWRKGWITYYCFYDELCGDCWTGDLSHGLGLSWCIHDLG